MAIKVLPPYVAADPRFRQRFEREARAISSLDHPHICALYDVGDGSGTRFLVIQYLEGETLAARLTRTSTACCRREAISHKGANDAGPTADHRRAELA